MSTLAHAAATIDAALADADEEQHREHRRDRVAEELVVRRAMLAAARPTRATNTSDAAPAIADYVWQELASRHQR